MNVLHRDPLVLLIEDFLQPGEAEHMIAAARPLMERSGIFADGAKTAYSEARTSSNAFLDDGGDHVIRCIEERASLISNVPVNYTEPLQVVWYRRNQEFRPHHDYISAKNLKHDYWAHIGQRYVTMLVYLNEPAKGGNTLFPTLKLDVPPKKNAALFWYNINLDGVEDERTLHGGSPVDEGEKYAINIWQRKMLPHVQAILDASVADD
ncbi:hypothetical protein THASP1DRAFT_28974 [Thamnocephalis sphaerospora]|uniref:Fe2OG dioxygenase domain-containing protein n=1 Tax=Thamnocephalis sphaerospora TaxID=78915 RepID=A0A4P9XSX8_9FUNG|nr:hypothetical protein THASP1DRAFT_28974 [Thamnocephalis sphaerospora]|eukprot:RKP09243.1 hypothetical protein THASP1DRAFT_28974 [Thamnocephalis sphaerospora]